MAVQVQRADSGYRLAGDWDGEEAANAFLAHLSARAFSQATIRAYAFDLVNFARFLAGQGVVLAAVSPVEVLAWVDCRAPTRHGGSGTVVVLRSRHAAASTVNRRVATVRAFFEYLVMTGCPPG
jgi:site-specific recombinase XerD